MRNFPDDIWDKVRALAILEHKPVAAVLAELVEDALSRRWPKGDTKKK